MKILRAFLVPTLVASLTASIASVATAAPSIPADLSQRAAELRRPAPAELLGWVHEHGVALAKADGAVDLAVLERAVRSQFGKRPPVAKRGASTTGPHYENLGSLGDGDIMAICFIVMMEAAKSAQDDLKAIMDGVKAINKQKDGLREVQDTINKEAASHASPTPTPGPNRVAQLVTAARSIVGKTQGANLSNVLPR